MKVIGIRKPSVLLLIKFGEQFGLLYCEIWKHKNNVIFKGDVIDVLELFTLIQLKV